MGKRVVKMGLKSPIWTINDLAEFIGASVASIRRYYTPGYQAKAGARDFKNLPRYYIGGMWRWDRDEVLAFIKA